MIVLIDIFLYVIKQVQVVALTAIIPLKFGIK